MSFMGIFRSKNRKNRVLYDSKHISPNDKDTCNCTAEEPVEQKLDNEPCQVQTLDSAFEFCEEQCKCCEEACSEETSPEEDKGLTI